MLENEYKVVTYSSESVVKDRTNKRIVSCPTEKEAWDYILEIEEQKKNQKSKRKDGVDYE